MSIWTSPASELGRTIQRVAPFGLLALAVACGEKGTSPTAIVRRPQSMEAREVALAQALAAPLQPISSTRARELAEIFVKQLGPQMVSAWETNARRKIVLSELRATTVELAESPYEPLDVSFPVYVRKAYGPFYIVVFSHGSSPTVKVAVSALNSDVIIQGNRLRFGRVRGSDFFGSGIPTAVAPMLSSQRVEQFVAEKVGGTAKAKDRLMLRGLPFAPTAALREVRSTPSNAIARRAIGAKGALFVSSMATILVASPVQPDAVDIEYPRLTVGMAVSEHRRIQIRVGAVTMLQPLSLSDAVRGGGTSAE